MENIYLRDKSFGFEIAHVLKELGFRKESKFYYIKAGNIVGSFPMRENNFWHFKHYDFNQDNRFVPSMGEPWFQNNHKNYPIYDKFGFEGYICTCPTYKQVFDFCDRLQILLLSKEEPRLILESLIKFYREKVHQMCAFYKYERAINKIDDSKKEIARIQIEKSNWIKEHLSEIRSITANSPRGDWFWYASVYDGYVYAIGEEEGNYAGGDLCSAKGGENRLKAFIEENLAKTSPDSYEGSLYEKIKDMPIATFEKYQEMENKLKEFDEREYRAKK